MLKPVMVLGLRPVGELGHEGEPSDRISTLTKEALSPALLGLLEEC